MNETVLAWEVPQWQSREQSLLLQFSTIFHLLHWWCCCAVHPLGCLTSARGTGCCTSWFQPFASLRVAVRRWWQGILSHSWLNQVTWRWKYFPAISNSKLLTASSAETINSNRCVAFFFFFHFFSFNAVYLAHISVRHGDFPVDKEMRQQSWHC